MTRRLFASLALAVLLCVGLSFSPPPDPVTYYVNTAAAAGGDGTTQALTGANCAWDTIADVNAVSFAEGDSVLISRGTPAPVYREQLTVPSSGSAGLPITIGAYGTGAKPIISGANLIATWTEVTGPALSDGSEFTDNFNDNDITDWTVTGTGITASGGVVNAAYTASNEHSARKAGTARSEYYLSYDWNITSLSFPDGHWIVGHGIYSGGNARLSLGVKRVGTDYLYQVQYQNDAGTQTVVTATAITAGSSLNILMRYKVATGAGQNNGIGQIWIGGVSLWALTNIDSDTLTANAALVGDRYSTNASNAVSMTFDNVALGTATIPGAGTDIWQAALTTDPAQIFFDGILGTEESGTATLDAENEWYWASNVLYVYSTSDPDAAYTDPGIESPTRANTLNISGKNYVTIENIRVEKGLSRLAYILNTTGVVLNNIDFDYGGGPTTEPQVQIIAWEGTSANNTMSNCSLSNSGSYAFQGWASTGLTLTGNVATGWVGYPAFSLATGCTGTLTLCVAHDNASAGNGSALSSGFLISGGSTATLNYCDAYNTTEDGFDVGTGGGGDASVAVLNYCRAWGNGRSDDTTSGDAFSAHDQTTLTMNYCIGYGNRRTGVAIVNNADSVLYNCDFYGNDVVGWETSYGITIESDGDHAIKNCIFQGHDYEIYQAAAATGAINVNYNCYHNILTANAWKLGATAYNFADWKTNSSHDANSLDTDPLMTDPDNGDFRLLPTSPCINAGTDVGLTTDYAGNPIGDIIRAIVFQPIRLTVRPIRDMPDIGAYEYKDH